APGGVVLVDGRLLLGDLEVARRVDLERPLVAVCERARGCVELGPREDVRADGVLEIGEDPHGDYLQLRSEAMILTRQPTLLLVATRRRTYGRSGVPVRSRGLVAAPV